MPMGRKSVKVRQVLMLGMATDIYILLVGGNIDAITLANNLEFFIKRYDSHCPQNCLVLP